MAMCEFSAQRMRDCYLPIKEKRIPAKVWRWAEQNADAYSVRWCVWLEPFDYDNLLFRTFACKKIRNRRNEPHKTYVMETMREVPGHDMLLRREMWCGACNGWTVYFRYPGDVTPLESWAEVGVYTDIKNRPGISYTILNPELILQTEKFKYCGLKPGSQINTIEYLHRYLENPGVEYFAKKGLIPHKSLVNKAMKDGNFRKWLRSLAPETVREANLYGPTVTIKAYKEHKKFHAAYKEMTEHLQLCRKVNQYARDVVKAGWKPERVNEYLNPKNQKQCWRWDIYRDYIVAAVYLNLDLKDTKNAFPQDLKRMHDLRIDEMNSKKAAEDAEKRKELYDRFAAAADGLKRFECSGAFCIVIPTSPQDLVYEGNALCHCVGKMGYDKKMADGRSFIAFLRNPDDVKKPFVTIEYNLKDKRLQQCYGAHDKNPDDAPYKFAEQWAMKVTETLKAEEREQRRLAELAAEEEERQRVARNRAERMVATA